MILDQAQDVMEKKVGYARVASTSSDIQEQIQKLKDAGCREIFTDNGKAGWLSSDRSGLESALAALDTGDTFVVCTIDRISRSMPENLQFIETLMARGIEFEALEQPEMARKLMHQINYAQLHPRGFSA